MTNGYMRNASMLYRQNSVAGSVEGADPHQLIGMLLDGAIERIRQAKSELALGDIAAKGNSITRAIAIVGELRACLDHKVSPAFSQRLDSLYEYVSRRLLQAQLNNDPHALDESAHLLAPVREGWQAIRDTASPAPRMPAIAGVA
ncbi:MAG TPA: flagellar export chaperone FliS [Rhodanobacter sp.]|nr:flagellar export chaperone FliS [Rhodanobacter sp.]